jgi:ribosome-associated translation inhibitor RaiA
MEESMSREANVVIHFKDLDNDDDVRDHFQERCRHLAAEFPETDTYELTLQPDSGGIEGHCHVTGKKTSVVATHSDSETARQAGDHALDKVERELRKEHDKRIFTPRRKAQKDRDQRFS